MRGDGDGIDHRRNIVASRDLDGADLVTGSEPVEEVDERHPAAKRRSLIPNRFDPVWCLNPCNTQQFPRPNPSPSGVQWQRVRASFEDGRTLANSSWAARRQERER